MPIIPFMIPGAEVAATGGVMVGRVEDLEAFCEQLRRHEESEPGFLDSLAKVVLIDQTFSFTEDIFSDRLKEAWRSMWNRLTIAHFTCGSNDVAITARFTLSNWSNSWIRRYARG